MKQVAEAIVKRDLSARGLTLAGSRVSMASIIYLLTRQEIF